MQSKIIQAETNKHNAEYMLSWLQHLEDKNAKMFCLFAVDPNLQVVLLALPTIEKSTLIQMLKDAVVNLENEQQIIKLNS